MRILGLSGEKVVNYNLMYRDKFLNQTVVEGYKDLDILFHRIENW